MNVFKTVFKKELKSVFRGGFSLLFSLLLPLILMPFVLTLVIKQNQKTDNNLNQPKIALYIKDNNNNVNVSETTTTYKEQLNYVKNVILKDADEKIINVNNDLNQAFADDKIDVAMYIDKDIKKNFDSGKTNIKIVYNMSYASGVKYAEYVINQINKYSSLVSEHRLNKLGSSVDKINGINLQIDTIQNTKAATKSEGLNNALLISLVPTLIIGMISFGSSSVSSELFSIEKERNTIESLLSTSAKRSQILWAKLAINWMFSLFGMILQFISIVIAYFINYSYFNTSEIFLSWTTITLLIVSMVGLSFLAATLNILVYVFSKNNKNATAYNAILTFIPIIVSYLVMTLSPSNINIYQIFIPFVGSVFSIKMALVGSTNIFYLLLSSSISIVISIVLTYLIFKRYNSEKILYDN